MLRGDFGQDSALKQLVRMRHAAATGASVSAKRFRARVLTQSMIITAVLKCFGSLFLVGDLFMIKCDGASSLMLCNV